MLDNDGIERPDDPHGHMLTMPTKKTIKLKKLHASVSFNKLVRFFSYFLRIFVCLILAAVFKIMYRFKIKGKEHQRAVRGKGVVAVGNHCHMLDVTFYAIGMMPQTVFITSIPQNFYIPIAGGLIKALGGFPIPWDLKSGREFKESVDEILKRKKAVFFLPEAAMWPYYRELRPFKNGAFKFATKNNAPILPTVVTIQIVHKSLKKKKHRISIEFLPAHYPDPSLNELEATQKLQAEVHQAMQTRLNEVSKNDIFTKRYLRQTKNISKQ